MKQPATATRSELASALDLDRLLGPDAARSPEMEAVWQWLAEEDGGVPNWLTLPAVEARALQNRLTERWNREQPDVASVAPLTLPGVPPVPAELVTPFDAQPGCILFIHGGGWAFGTLGTYARLTRLLARETRTRVLSVDYRLAPEHPFPAPFDDALTAWRALVERAGDPGFEGPLAVAGDSAGANLALAVALHEIAANRRRPDNALLFYGAYEAGVDSPSALRFAEGYGLTRAGMARFWDWYAPPGGPTDRGDPRVSPLRAADTALARLPPVFLNAAGLDPLLSDTVALGRRLEAAGITHQLHVHEGVHHGFMQMSLKLPEAQAAIRRAAAFFGEHARGN